MNDVEREMAFKVYSEINSRIRATDEISFKLQSLVPIFSGGGVGILAYFQQPIGPVFLFLASVSAVVFTYGVYRWEMRNTNNCSSMIDRANNIEKFLLESESGSKKTSLFIEPRDKPKFFGVEIGKTEAERIIYYAAMGIWLIPIIHSITLLCSSAVQ